MNPRMRRARLALQRLTPLTITPSQVAYIATPDAAVHSVYGFYINYFAQQMREIS